MIFKLFIQVIIALLISIQTLQAKTIQVPGDADHIKDAVELAVSGDEIHLVSDVVGLTTRAEDVSSSYKEEEPRITFKNKDIRIIGKMPVRTRIATPLTYSVPSTEGFLFWIEDSYVSIENCELSSVKAYNGNYYYESMSNRVLSGTLTLIQCDFTTSIECTGNLKIVDSILKGDTSYSGLNNQSGNTLKPAIQFGPSRDTAFIVQNSTITSNTPNGFINFVIRGATESQISLLNSRFEGNKGRDGVSIQSCIDIVVIMDNNAFRGGVGYDAGITRTGTLFDGGVGGSGISITDSMITLSSSGLTNFVTGGKGGNAGYDVDRDSKFVQLSAGQGGSGVAITRSTVTLVHNSSIEELIQAVGGPGGDPFENDSVSIPEGPEGLPFAIDQESEIRVMTPVQNWMMQEREIHEDWNLLP